jgi:DNA-binding beta-propeller fold protein YncE
LGRPSVFLSDHDGTPAPIGYLTDPGAVVFSADSTSLFVVNGAKHQIAVLDLSSGSIEGTVDTSSFAGGASVPDTGSRNRRPASTAIQDLAVSADGSKLYAMSGQTICGYDLPAGNMPSCSNLEVAPRSFQSMRGGMFLLNYSRAGSMPLWLLDGKTGETWFVPAGNTAANASF